MKHERRRVVRLLNINNLTYEQKIAYRTLSSLQILLQNDTVLDTETAQQYIQMISKKKKELVYSIYFQGKEGKGFHKCKDGRIKSYKPQFFARSEDDLIEKLYSYYFQHTLADVFEEWVHYRLETKIVANKTIQEDISIWNRFIKETEISTMQISTIKARHILKLFHIWTGNGLITKKDFNNRKSVLNGIFGYAVMNELIEVNIITSLTLQDLKFKLPVQTKKAYTEEERTKMLAYLDTLQPDAYILAIKLAFYGLFRVGEIKGLSWEEEDGCVVKIEKQLVEEHEILSDLSLGIRQTQLKQPKGNPNYSIRTECLSEKGMEVLKTMKRLNPDGQLLFMHNGKPITTDRFNARLKKYCKEIDIPYLSSHKIRFSSASILYDNGTPIKAIKELLGHSNLAMTEHYIQQPVNNYTVNPLSQVLN